VRDLLRLLKEFRTDQRGAFAVLFGVLSIALVAVAGAVVDFTSVQQSRGRAQEALDAAALALQPKIYTEDNATLQQQAQDLLVERVHDKSVTVKVESVTTDTATGTLHLQAQIIVPTSFISLIGVADIPARLVSEATRKKLHVEVSMVLDNSGSMATYSRMTNLKAAAKNAVNKLFTNATSDTSVYVGIVPFTELVNVGTSNASASWMDRRGTSAANPPETAAITRNNFDNNDNSTDTFDGPVDRIALMDSMSNVSWGGCVEARKSPYDTTDAAPDPSNPDTLFTPAFAPDLPDEYGSGNYISDSPAQCNKKVGSCSCTTSTSTSSSGGGGSSDWWWSSLRLHNGQSEARILKADWWGGGGYGGGGYGGGGYGGGGSTTTTSCTLTNLDGTTSTGSSACSCPSGSTKVTNADGSTTTSCDVYDTGASLPKRERQERMCKYNGATANFSSLYGPNGDCPAAAIQPLTNQKTTVLNEIDSMYANGGTNIHQGVIWGFRVLSPTPPFTEGNPYDSATYKTLILMTDGENTFYTGDSGFNGSTLYSAYGWLYNGRIGSMGNSSSTIQSIMNSKTLAACANAKAAGIEIYTIGLSSPNSTTTNMLTQCASGADHAYFPTDPAQLTPIFEDIANKLSDLRLSQ
jgi:Flp pilus assembly protein TadG